MVVAACLKKYRDAGGVAAKVVATVAAACWQRLLPVAGAVGVAVVVDVAAFWRQLLLVVAVAVATLEVVAVVVEEFRHLLQSAADEGDLKLFLFVLISVLSLFPATASQMKYTLNLEPVERCNYGAIGSFRSVH